ncbi:MAG: DUF134 domain-containing protein [Ichthyobacteriaceae bacterium]|nr:DUF134 domain-containing protein [Ichthyobacteriaceae bacterium]
MARPKNSRIVSIPPLFNEFKPSGIKRSELQEVNLSIDEYESIRLADSIGLSHLEASEEMDISRSTFSRLIEGARRKMAEFVVKGKVLKIEGGNIHFDNNIIKCHSCGYMIKTSISDHISECPECKSTDLFNVAGNFGHGKCCVENKKNKGLKK